MKYQFSGFTFDADTFELSSAAGETIALQPRALELLYFLLRQPRSLARKEDILREVWGGVAVSSGALSLQVFKLREALGDSETPHQLIQTIKRQGLRLDADVSVTDAGPDTAHAQSDFPLAAPLTSSADEQPSRKLIGDCPKIVVLPFRSKDFDHSVVAIAGAIPTDIISALSRLTVLRVISRASSFLLGQNSQDSSATLTSLGASYCLSGSVNKIGELYQLFAELIDLRTQTIIWCEVFEAPTHEFHATRDSIVQKVADRIAIRIPRFEARRALIKQPDSFTAWEAYHVGLSISSRRGVANARRARQLFQRAVTIDPTFARAQAEMSSTFSRELVNRSFDKDDPMARKMLEHADAAMNADPEDPAALLVYGWARQITQNDSSSKAWYEQALQISPSSAWAHAHLATLCISEKRGEEAVEHCKAALELDPLSHYRFNNFASLALASLLVGDFEETIKWGYKAGGAPFDEVQPLLASICANHAKGDTERAQMLANRFKSSFPDVSWGDFFGRHLISEKQSGFLQSIFTGYGI